MGNVEFPSKRRGTMLNRTYGGLSDDSDDEVSFNILTPDGDLLAVLGPKAVEELHDSLGAWLDLRKQRKDSARNDRKRIGNEGTRDPRREGTHGRGRRRDR